MPRPPRLLVPGGVYHVTSRGNRRQPIYLSDRDHVRFLELTAAVVARRGWRCHSYCLIPNHYHLLLETPQADLSRGMQRLNSAYAQWFNECYGLSGHVFQGRFSATLIESQAHLLEAARYIVLNPVRAGLCAGPADWRWSSFAAVAGTARTPAFLTREWLLGAFGADEASAAARFAAFVADAAESPS